MSRCLRPLPGTLLIAGLLMTPASGAARMRSRPCDLFLESYQALGKVAEFKIALRCESGRKEAFPINEPLLIGLTATTSNDERENDSVRDRVRFSSAERGGRARHHGGGADLPRPLSDIFGNLLPWPGRAASCKTAPEDARMRKIRLRLGDAGQRGQDLHEEGRYGEMTVIDDLMCKGSTDYRFKFR